MNTIHIKKTDKNMTPEIYRILEAISPEEETVIEFEKGTYYFHREGSRQYDLYSSGGKSVKNYVVFPIQNKHNLTIRGNGAEFVFCDRMQPFVFQNCTGIRLEDFSVDYSFIRYAWGTVTTATEAGFCVRMDREKFRWFVDGNKLCFQCGMDVLSSGVRKFSCKRIMPEKSSIYFLYVGDTAAPVHGAAPNVCIDAEDSGEDLFFRYREASPKVCYVPGDVICIAYDNEREAQAFWFEDTKDICLSGISIYRCGGMGVVADVCEDIRIEKLRIALKPGREEFYPTTADGIFLTNCKGVFELRDSLISGTYDDAMNIHGYYLFVDEVLSENRIRVGYRLAAHWGVIPCKIGDVLRVSDGETLDEIGVVKVIDMSVNEDRTEMVLTLDDVTQLIPGMLLENPDRMPHVLIENNVVENCPHMRLSAGEMIVRNNRLDLNDMDIYINDLIGFWGESGAVQNVQICGNSFGKAEGPNILVKSFRPETSNRLHRHLRIEDNRFVYARERALRISAVQELKEENNTFGGRAND